MIIVMSFAVSCAKEDSIEDVFVDPNSSISKSDVVGIYSFYCYSGPLYYELEVEFNDDFSGNSTQKSYDSHYNLMSVNNFVFIWRIEGEKILLNGSSATVNSEGEIGYSYSRSGSFEMKHDILVPDKGFVEGYAKYALRIVMENDVYNYYSSSLELDVDNNMLYFSFITELTDRWPEKTIKYGVRGIDGTEYYTTPYTNKNYGDLKLTNVLTGSAALYYESVVALTEAMKTRSLTNSEKSLMSGAKDGIKQYVKSFNKGNEYQAIVKIGDEVINCNCNYTSKYSSLINY